MSSKPNDFKLGLFVLIGLVILVAGLFIFGASKWFQGKSVIETYVDGPADGLKAGAPVTLRGVPVGQVTRINFTWNIFHVPEPRYVYVEFEVDKKVSLVPPGKDYAQLVAKEVEKGLRARIKSQGLASGTSIVSLEYVDPDKYPPLHVPWKPQHTYVPSASSQMSEIMSGLDKTVTAIKQIDFKKIGEIVEADLHTGGRLLTNAYEMNLGEIGTNMNALVEEVRGVAAQLKTFIGTTNQTSTDLERIARNADELVARLQTTTAKLDGVVGNLDVESLNETLEGLRRASRKLEEAIGKVKEYPAGAIFGEPPPPARSVERSSR